MPEDKGRIKSGKYKEQWCCISETLALRNESFRIQNLRIEPISTHGNHASNMSNMTGLKEQRTNKTNVTIPSTMHGKPSQYSLKGHKTSQMPEQKSTLQVGEQQTASPPSDPSTDTIMERMEKAMNEQMNPSPHSQTLSELLNDQFIDPAINDQTASDSNSVKLIPLPRQTAVASQDNDGQAPSVPKAAFTDVADMSQLEFDQLLASAPSLFPEDSSEPTELNAPAEQKELLAQGVNQAVGEALFTDLSPDTLDRIFRPTLAALNELNPLAESAVDDLDFGDTSDAELESFPVVSAALSNSLSPGQQYPYPAPSQVYPPIPDCPEDIYRLPNQPGQYTYPPFQCPNVQSQSNSYPQERPQPQSRKVPYAKMVEDDQRFAHQAPCSDRGVAQHQLTERKVLQPRPRGTNLVSPEHLQHFNGSTQPTQAAQNIESSPLRSKKRISPGSDASTESSSEHPVIERQDTPKPQMPKSLASNYYRIYAADEKAKKDQTTSARTKKILAFEPEEHYAPLKKPPKPWDVFKYTDKGELEPSTYYKPEEIHRFLYNNPQHKRKGLILWIQRKPADSGRRYPNHTSQRCRFFNCAARGNLIGSGQYRVAFDQLSLKCKNYDPHYNAGYVHLYCLEKFLDFPKICQNITVRPENRKLPEEPKHHNNMALSLKEEIEFAKVFIRNCRKGRIPPNYPNYKIPKRPHVGTLTHALSCVKLQFEPKTAKKRRAERGTKTALEWHEGDLERETELSTKSAAAKKGMQTKKANARKSRWGDDVPDDEAEEVGDDSEAEDERPHKRQKTRQTEVEEVEEPVNPLAGPLARAKKRSIDRESESSSPKRRRSPRCNDVAIYM